MPTNVHAIMAAVHDAAHAVMATTEGIVIEKVVMGTTGSADHLAEVHPDEDAAAKLVQSLGEDDAAWRRFLLSTAKIGLAARYADVHINNLSESAAHARGREDMIRFSQFCDDRKVDHSERQKLVRTAEAFLERWIHKKSTVETVSRIARRLVEQRVISGDVIREIMADAKP